NPPTWERLLIRLSVMPSLRYSVLGSELEFTKGSTASDSIAGPPRSPENANHPATARTPTTTAAAAQAALLRSQRQFFADGPPARTAARFDSVSRLNRARSARRSDAL